MIRGNFLAMAATALGLVTGGASAQFGSVRVASGLVRPCFVTHAPGDFTRVFIVEQSPTSTTGRVRILDLTTGTLLATPFLTVSPISTGGERGLLGLAFAPDYSTSGLFYVNYTDPAGETVVAQYQVSGDPNVASPTAVKTVYWEDQPFSNHNGGWIGFGPDGYLYIANGDGGSAGDPGNRSQNKNLRLGKMLRVDPTGDDFPDDPNLNYAIPPANPFVGVDGDDAIWAYGLRNPWRNAFDRVTGDLYIADVGQNVWEEVNYQGVSSMGGENYGWRCYEANAAFSTGGCDPPSTMVFPIHAYSHSGGNCSVTGGYVYRGCAIPSLDGHYFYADFCTNQIWSFTYDPVGGLTQLTNRTAQLAPGGGLSITSVSSFGEDAYGEMYICDLNGGEVFKIVPTGAPTPDCNANGRRDACDILAGVSEDWNEDGVPDECQCLADCEEDGDLDVFDYLCFQSAWGSEAPYGDWERDGDWDVFDFLAYQGAYALGCTF